MNVVFPQRIEKLCGLTNFFDKLLCHNSLAIKETKEKEKFVSLCVCVYTQLQQTSSPLFFFRPGKQPDSNNLTTSLRAVSLRGQDLTNELKSIVN